MINLLGYDEASLVSFFAKRSEKAFRAQQLIKWVHQQGELGFAQMSNLSLALRQDLQKHCAFSVPIIKLQQIADDGVVKWLFALDDGNVVESVFIPEHERGTLCISSQVGCYLDCSFCATALQGFNRNLSSAEIISQLWLARAQLQVIASTPAWQALRWQGQSLSSRISNVVFMGMGEPLLNMQSVSRSVNLMLDDNAYGLSKRRVTISTAGVAPMISRLAQHNQASLAISLHAAEDKKRDILVPLNQKYPIKILMRAAWDYIRSHENKRHILFEYVMLQGVNDALQDAKAVVKLLRDFPAKVNLIPFNAYAGLPYVCSSERQIDCFKDYLRRNHINTTVRKTRGQNIQAACGQLAGQVRNRVRSRQIISMQKIPHSPLAKV